MSETENNNNSQPKKLTPLQKVFLQALHKSLGIVSAASRETGIDRERHYAWLKANETYKELVDAIGDDVLDFAESKLYQLCEGVSIDDKGEVYQRPPDNASVMFLLKCKGKKRGYVERQEIISQNTNANIEITNIDDIALAEQALQYFAEKAKSNG